MNTLLHQKTAIITGAGQGIGFAIARRLARAGAHVLVNDAERGLAEEAVQKLQQEHLRATAVPGDVGDYRFNDFLVDEAVRLTGRIDIAVANAGITLFGNFLSYSSEDFDRVIRVNMGGAFFLTQAAAKKMISLNAGGKIILMSSVTGHQAHKDLAAYSMSKAGIEMLAKNLVIELASHRICVNAIAPGATLTERTTADTTYEQTWATLTPTGRASTAEDIAEAALFLSSPSSDQITGQTFVIDGGWSSVSPSPY